MSDHYQATSPEMPISSGINNYCHECHGTHSVCVKEIFKVFENKADIEVLQYH
jgi:hypothetical protein